MLGPLNLQAECVHFPTIHVQVIASELSALEVRVKALEAGMEVVTTRVAALEKQAASQVTGYAYNSPALVKFLKEQAGCPNDPRSTADLVRGCARA